MITFDATYTAAVSAPNAVTDWLLELINDAPGTMYLSSGDHTVSGTLYHGLVRDWGSIDESLDLKKCKIKVSDVTITVDNTWHNASGKLGAELFSGTDHYLNHDITIKGWSPGLASGGLAPFYRGRLIDIVETDDGAALKLTIEPRSPWDFIKIPQTKSVYGGIYEPVVYGDFTPNASVSGSETNCTSRALWPMPTVGVVQADIRAVVHSGTIASGRGHFYDKSLDKYIPVLDNAATGYQDSSVTHDTAVDAVPVDTLLQRVVDSDRFKERSNNDSVNFADIIDLSTYRTAVTVDVTTVAPTETQIFGVSIVLPDGEVESAITVTFDWSLVVDTLTIDPVDDATLQLKDNAGSNLQLWSFPTDGIEGFTDSGQEETFTLAAGTSAFNISVVAGMDTAHAGNQMIATLKIRDLRVELNCKLDSSGDAEAVKKRLNDIKYLYSGANGPDMTYTGAPSGPTVLAEEPHHIFRDVLERFTGVDMADADITNWAAADAARQDWNCRLWVNEPTPLIDILDRLAYEGAFLWQQHGATARIIPLKAAYSSADVSLTGSQLDNIKIGHTPFKDMVSSRVYTYNYDPVSEEGNNTYDSGDAVNGNRSLWDFETEENIETIDLQYLCYQPAVAALATVNNIFFGEPRLTITADVVDPAKSLIEIGDVLAFSSMPREPLGGTFTSTYWMVEKSRREPDKLQITARQVG